MARYLSLGQYRTRRDSVRRRRLLLELREETWCRCWAGAQVARAEGHPGRDKPETLSETDHVKKALVFGRSTRNESGTASLFSTDVVFSQCRNGRVKRLGESPTSVPGGQRGRKGKYFVACAAQNLNLLTCEMSSTGTAT